MSIINGQVPVNFYQAILGDGGLLTNIRLMTVHKEDQQALVHQQIENTWAVT